MLLLEELQCFRLAETAAALGVVLYDEIHEGLTDDHAHLDRLAGISAILTAATLEDRNIGRSLED